MRAPLLKRAALLVALSALASASAWAQSTRERAAALAAQQNRTPISRSLLQRCGGKPVIKVRGGAEASRVARALPNTFEVIFRPDASEWGHAHVRVGDRVFDLGAAYFSRNESIGSASWINRDESYGFVFSCDQGTACRLQSTFADKVQKYRTGALKYQLKPWETPTPQGENCETFVVNTLRSVCPTLGIYPGNRYAGATGLARWCLTSPKLEAITIYSTSDAAARESFKLRKVAE